MMEETFWRDYNSTLKSSLKTMPRLIAALLASLLVLGTGSPCSAAAANDDWRIARMSREAMIAMNLNATRLGISGSLLVVLMVQPDTPQPITLIAFEVDCATGHSRAVRFLFLRDVNDTEGTSLDASTSWDHDDGEFQIDLYKAACLKLTPSEWVPAGSSLQSMIDFYYETFLGKTARPGK